jgi:hypothetical protein
VSDWRGNRRVLIHAVLNFASDYHSGQWSRGYRLLCRSFEAARRYGMHHPLDYGMTPKAQEVYNYLVRRYGDEV